MTEFSTIVDNNPTKGTMYTITFKTDNKAHFEHLQEEARKCMDNPYGKPAAPIIKCLMNCMQCEHQCKGPDCAKVPRGELCQYFKEIN